MKGCEGLDTVVVCVLATDETPFSDNEIGRCHFCKGEVQHRPHVPTPNTLVCRCCFVDRVEDGDEFQMTRECVQETRLVLGRTSGVH